MCEEAQLPILRKTSTSFVLVLTLKVCKVALKRCSFFFDFQSILGARLKQRTRNDVSIHSVVHFTYVGFYLIVSSSEYTMLKV